MGMVVGLTSTTHTVLLSARCSPPPGKPARAARKRTLRVLSVAQSFETQSSTATATSAEQPHYTPQPAGPVTATPEEEHPHPPQDVPRDVVTEFEHKLEADLQSVAVTLTAVTGVIIYWRGVWSLLDNLMGDSVFGDICCIIVGLTIVLWIRLSGVKVASTFWPPS